MWKMEKKQKPIFKLWEITKYLECQPNGIFKKKTIDSRQFGSADRYINKPHLILILPFQCYHPQLFQTTEAMTNWISVNKKISENISISGDSAVLRNEVEICVYLIMYNYHQRLDKTAMLRRLSLSILSLLLPFLSCYSNWDLQIFFNWHLIYIKLVRCFYLKNVKKKNL